MKGLSILAAFLGGAAVGAACGILFAPEKGDTTRTRIAEAIRKRGVKLSGKEVFKLLEKLRERPVRQGNGEVPCLPRRRKSVAYKQIYEPRSPQL